MSEDVLHQVPPYLRPPPDPYLRKGKPIVNKDVPKEGAGIGELINRGHQLLRELDRVHERLNDATKDALSPRPQSWKLVKAAMTDYSAAYSELLSVGKRLNFLLNAEHPELAQPANVSEAKVSCFGDWSSPRKG